MKSRQKVKLSIGPLERSDGTSTMCDMEVVDELNRYFESTFVQEDMSSLPVPSFTSEGSICDVNVSESLMLQKLCSLKENKAPGPDCIHSYILKACAHSLCMYYIDNDIPAVLAETYLEIGKKLM